mgnify:CR=1 FL=1
MDTTTNNPSPHAKKRQFAHVFANVVSLIKKSKSH